MLDQLLETKQATQRKPLGTVVSVVLHAVLIAVAVQLTQQAASARVTPIEVVIRQPIAKTEPKPIVEKPPLDAVAHAPAKFGFQLIQAPIDIPVDLPAVDLSAAPTDALD